MKKLPALAALLVLVTAATAAASDAPRQAPAVPVAKTGIDLQARSLLDRMHAAYRALSSYSGSVVVWSGNPTPAVRVRASLLIRRPDRAAIEISGAAGVTRVVADGTAIRLLAPGAASPRSENPGDGGAVAAALRKTGLLETRIGRLLTGQDLFRADDGKLQALRLGGAGLAAGVPVEKVVAVVSTAQGEQTITLALGKQDHLLRQVVATSGAGSFSESETEMNVQSGTEVPDAAFAIRRPGAPQAAQASTPPAAAGAALAGQPGPVFTGRLPVTPAGPLPPPVRYDFGQVTLIDTTRVEHEFHWKNAGSAPVKVIDLHSSCGCTSALVAGPSGSAPGNALPTVAPGEEISVKVTVDLTPLRPGQIHKSVTVYAEGSPAPVALFEIAGTLRGAVSFSPAAINLGSMEVGAAHSVAFTATLDPRIAAAGPLPPLVCSNPAVQVRPDPDPHTPGGDAEVRRFVASVAPDTAIGSVSGMISFAAPPAAGASSAAHIPAGVAAALRSSILTVFGRVTGAITAAPLNVAFGVVLKGQTVSRQVTLTARDAGIFDQLSATAGDPALTCRLLPLPEGAAPAISRTLEVTLGAEVPLGILRSEVVVKLANGQRLVLPATAYVRESRASAGQ